MMTSPSESQIARTMTDPRVRPQAQLRAIKRAPTVPFSNGRGAAVGTACDVQLLSGVDEPVRRWRVFAYRIMRSFDVTAPDEVAAVEEAWKLIKTEREAAAATGA
jgi:hypothetical protein